MNLNRGKKIGILLAVPLLLLAGVAGYLFTAYHIVDLKLYPKNSRTLDLREEDISISHYDKLRAALPDCEIRWNVPFQEGFLADDTQEVTISTLTEADVEVLTYLPLLKTVHAESCESYDLLLQLQQSCPDAAVNYTVAINGAEYPQDTTLIQVGAITDEEIALLKYLPGLETVCLSGGTGGQDFSSLQSYCAEQGLAFGVKMGEQLLDQNTKEITASGITEEELSALAFLPQLQTLHLVSPTVPADRLLALKEQYPNVKISWEVTIGGLTFSSENTPAEIDLSQVVVTDLAAVEAAMAYLPDAEKLIFGLCGIDNPEWGNSRITNLAVSAIENEDLSAYRDRVREDYKVVWTARLGPSIALRTDADNFMPNHFGVGIMTNEYSRNLKYFEDMVCLDLGHMTLDDVSFLAYMPDLEYLILAHTQVRYIDAVSNCKKLKFLELDWSLIKDLTPLKECTALEDLNIGQAWPDVTALFEMPWLKNVYMIFGSKRDAWRVSQALPNTRVVSSGNATVGGGWRRLPNYYAMRDCLGMYYMN